jgi:hypothetical protein
MICHSILLKVERELLERKINSLWRTTALLLCYELKILTGSEGRARTQSEKPKQNSLAYP